MAESALKELVQQSAEPFVRSYNPFNPAFRETIRATASDLLGGRAIGGTPSQRYRAQLADLLTGSVDFMPGVSDAVAVSDTVQAARGGDYGTAAILGGATMLGMVPVIGDSASKAIREGLDMSTAGKAVAAKKGIHPAIQEYAQNAGLDPRILQAGSGKQISNPRIADLERIQGLNVNIGNQRIQEVPVFNIEDYEGYPIMSSMSDRAAAGDVILDVNGVPVNVNRRGGQDFMFDPINQGKVWASDAAVVLGEGPTRMMNMAQRLKQQYGKDPLFAPWTMAPTGVDYSTMTGETMLQYAANNMNKSALRSLNKDLKNIFPDWQGIESPRSMQQFYAGSGDDRKAVIQLLDKKYRDKGSMTSGEARIAVTDAAQLRNPDGTLRNVGKIEASAAPFTEDVHPTYNTALPGAGVGRLQSPLQVYELFPDATRLGGFDPMNPPRPALRALEMKPYATLITEDLIRGIQARRLNQP